MARSTQIPSNPVDAERAISARLLEAAQRRVESIEDQRQRDRLRGEWVQRLRRELAYRRLLARLFTSRPHSWVLKGGVALLYRLDPNRPSYDVDIAYIESGADHAIALTNLKRGIEMDLGDWFSFDLGDPRQMTDLAGAITVAVTARVGAKEFARFSIDMPSPREDVSVDVFEMPPSGVGFDVLDEVPQLQLLQLESQLADKICAMFERHGAEGSSFSSRSRDLADIAMIATQRPVDGSRLERSLTAEVGRRADARLPNGLPTRFEIPHAQQRQWRDTWQRSARNAPVVFDDALEISTAILGPLFSGSVAGLTWDPDARVWAPSGIVAP